MSHDQSQSERNTSGPGWQVQWHKKGHKFQAMCSQCKRKQYLGLHVTVGNALARVQQHFQTVHPDQELPAAKKKRKRKIPAKKDLAIFSELYLTFKHCIPGDLEAAALADKAHRQMYEADALYELLSVMGKIMPFKEALFQAWQTKAPKRPRLSTSEPDRERAQQAAEVLQEAARLLSNKNFPAWSECSGRNNQFHSGHLKALQDWKIVEHQRAQTRSKVSGPAQTSKTSKTLKAAQGSTSKTSKTSRQSRSKTSRQSRKLRVASATRRRTRASKPTVRPPSVRKPPEPEPDCVLLGMHGTPYRILNGRAATKILMPLTAAADIISSMLTSPPRTLLEWHTTVTDLKTRLAALCKENRITSICRLNHTGGYQLLWTFRAMSYARMQSRGLQEPRHLELDEASVEQMSVRMFGECFPDQNTWVRHFMPRDNRTLSGLVQALAWQKEPLELLTMWMCLLMDDDLRFESASWVQENQGALQQAAKEYRSKHGFWPHPAVCLNLCRRSLTSKRSITSLTSVTSACPPYRLRRKTNADLCQGQVLLVQSQGARAQPELPLLVSDGSEHEVTSSLEVEETTSQMEAAANVEESSDAQDHSECGSNPDWAHEVEDNKVSDVSNVTQDAPEDGLDEATLALARSQEPIAPQSPAFKVQLVPPEPSSPPASVYRELGKCFPASWTSFPASWTSQSGNLFIKPLVQRP